MGLLNRARNLVGRWRATDPYQYECTVCERTFQSERSACPDCGGDVERAAGGIGSTAVDPHP
jgi:rRNA maturation endonuclease Nob1